jgi:hypothetical protein
MTNSRKYKDCSECFTKSFVKGIIKSRPNGLEWGVGGGLGNGNNEVWTRSGEEIKFLGEERNSLPIIP